MNLEKAYLHILNRFNENTAIENKYKSLADIMDQFPVQEPQKEIAYTANSTDLRMLEEQQTRRLNVTIVCQAVYNSGINVPIDLSIEEALKYAKKHIAEIPLGSLEYVPDSDVLDEENCDFEDLEEELKGKIDHGKLSLSDQIKSASKRITTPQPETHMKEKEPTHEI